jgi:hypothetical protein
MAGATLDLSASVDVFATPEALTLDGNEQAVAITLPSGSYTPRVLQLICDTGWWIGRAAGDIAAGRKVWIPAECVYIVPLSGSGTITFYVQGTNAKLLTFLELAE